MKINEKLEQNELSFHRYFTKKDKHPYDEIEWDNRNSIIYDEKGEVVFQQENVEVPQSWSQLATDIVSSKYFRKSGLGDNGKESETSVRQLIDRVVKTLGEEGEKRGYFKGDDTTTFKMELTHILVNQMAAFNSPVWFNCGLYHQYNIEGKNDNYYWDYTQKKIKRTKTAYKYPQNSACFIQSVDDSLDSMLKLQQSEVKIFKYGSGTGSNFSKIRGKTEILSGGGASSGVISFLEGFDRWAGCIKSGGTTRRAAKMVLLDLDHPEIIEYIEWKSKEEKKALALIKAGYPSDFNGEAYGTVSGQNSNNSVRIPDKFMNAYLEDKFWDTRYRISNKTANTYNSKFLMNKIATEAHACADPGVQFDDTIQKWHTCKYTDRINASNPCSEYLFLDDSACNLASLNLVKFLKEDNTFDLEGFCVAVQYLIIAMEIIVDFSSYPTKKIAQNSIDYRPLGLGYANLGALCMILGYPYDSSQARSLAACISAIMSGYGYNISALLAEKLGPFKGYNEGTPKPNKESMLQVIDMHKMAAFKIDEVTSPEELRKAAQKIWSLCLERGKKWGYRNSQISVIAPTGTIALLMDCDTTGIEPEFSLIKFKKLAGGGYMKIVNNNVRRALKNLGYLPEQVDDIITHLVGTGTLKDAPCINPKTLKKKGLLVEEIERIDKILPQSFNLNLAFALGFLNPDILSRLQINSKDANDPQFNLLTSLGFSVSEIKEAETVICGVGTIEGAPHLSPAHYRIFDCAVPSNKDKSNYIRYMGSLELMEAVQPFISGAISKTVNIPQEATIEDIETLYVEAWKKGIKCLAVYRDGSKGSQPLSNQISSLSDEDELEPVESMIVTSLIRKRLPDKRPSIAHKFNVDGHEGYIHVGLYENGQPGEVFIRMNKEGSVISGLMDTIGILTSITLQYGVPLESLIKKFIDVRFEPSGYTSNSEIPMAKSLMDYIFRWLEMEFLEESASLKV